MYELLTTLLAATLSPQLPPPAPAEQSPQAPAIATPFAAGRTPLFDRPDPDGPWWTRGSNFKASFAANGWTFVPQPPAGATELEPLGFQLTDLRVGGRAMERNAGGPQRSGSRITYDHGTVLETLDIDADGIEQRFVFDSLPTRGELRVEMAVTTDLPASGTAEHIVFASRGGAVTYSHAIAIDAVGRRIAAPTTLVEGRITIQVPAEFVATAALPLVIDPRVAFAVPGTGNSDFAEPDVAVGYYLNIPTGHHDVCLAVYANYFGATDWDDYVIVYDPNLVPIAGPYVVDLSTDGWMRPRIAGIRDQFLVVAEVRSGSSVRRIQGRSAGFGVAGPSLGLGSPFAISFDTVECSHPDVGGNPASYYPFVPAYFTIVWERSYSAADHDIYVRQVDMFGALRPGPIAIQANTRHQTNPAISKHCGATVAGPVTPPYGIVYQERAWLGNEDIHGALLTFDGSPIAVNGSYTFPIDTSIDNDINPSVSSPSIATPDNRNLLLAAYERTSSNNGDIVATCFDDDGALLAQGNVSALENDAARLAWPQRRPSVDSDGQRFGVAYHEVYAGLIAINDLDTRISLVALAGSQLVVSEAASILGFSTDREFNVEVAAGLSGGVGVARYCTVNDRDNINNTFAIDVRTYDAVPADTFATRATACGTTTLNFAGHTVLGSSVTFTASLPGEFVLVLIGQPAVAPLPCASCVLGVANAIAYSSPTTVPIPSQISLIGAQLAAQGLALTFNSPQCFGYLQLSDTIDWTIQ